MSVPAIAFNRTNGILQGITEINDEKATIFDVSNLQVNGSINIGNISGGFNPDFSLQAENTIASTDASGFGVFLQGNVEGNTQSTINFDGYWNSNTNAWDFVYPSNPRNRIWNIGSHTDGLFRFRSILGVVPENVICLDGSNQSVGIGYDPDPTYALDVDGGVAAAGYTTFTGIHIGCLENVEFREGLVVSSTGEYYTEPTIMDAWVKLRLSDGLFDAGVVGVLSEKVDLSGRVHYNAVGEGMVLCNNQNGDIECGDLLCPSSTPGIAMKQLDSVVHNYTIGKASVNHEFSGSMEELVGCFYYCG